ncbi:basement membrane-specific heparan sulfate proteoglycan core protein-like [Mytilus californianus]|uniref:basement membrane-specific heparan sulfate proteoglycan core protein-like n=1 Tax=Mytilus californianus TaxID=6549 RepID=UPI0022467D49|nr:basement membrane-specific heparan sulfate proteoglycan core protein-like [Mytilus californianus]
MFITVSDKPIVIVPTSAYIVDVDSSITLDCQVTADPTHNLIYWQKVTGGNTETITINGGKYSGSSVSDPSLTISDVQRSDAGTYFCYATNIVETGSSTPVVLAVAGNTPSVSLTHNDIAVNNGNNVTIGCIVSANPSHTSVYWQKMSGGQTITIDMTNTSKYAGGTVATPSLHIIGADTSDAADYVCFAANSVGTGQSNPGSLTVAGSAPVVNVASNSYSVNIGNSITLQCTVQANPFHTSVKWQRVDNNGNAVDIDMTNSRYTGSAVNSPSLVISQTMKSDEGRYVCLATNAVGTGQSQQTFLTVVGSIPTVTVDQSSYSANKGSDITLQCSYTANPAATMVRWERTNGNSVVDIGDTTNNNRYGGSTVSSPSLIIYNAEESDEGNYKCKVTNSVGTGISTITNLDVVGNTPSVNLTQNNITVNYGNNVTIGCVVAANPSHTSVYWQKISGGQTVTIDVTNTSKYEGGTVASPSLYIIRADTSDAAKYVCFATSSVGTGQSTQGTLNVAGNIPIVTVPTSAYIVNVDSSITLACQVAAEPTHDSVYWQKVIGANTNIIQIDGEKYSGSSVSHPSLTIFNAQFSDTGAYYCYAANTLGTGYSTQIIVAVAGNTPNVSLTQNAINVDYGNNVTIGCVVSANPSHTSVYWQKISGEQIVTIDMTNTSKYEGGTVASPSLYIIRADTSDAANYVCFAANSVGTGQSSLGTLTVLGIIPIVTVPTSAYIVNVDSSITLACEVTADPTHNSVYWQKVIEGNTETIAINGGKYSGSSVSNPSLTISNTQLSDTGSYYCYSTNILGTGSSTRIIMAVASMNDAVPDTTVTESSGNQVIVPAILGTIIALMVIVFTAYVVTEKYKKSTRTNGKVSRRASVVHPTSKESNGKQVNPLPVEQDTIETADTLPREHQMSEPNKFQSLPPIDNRQFITDKNLLGRPMLLPIGKASDLNV